MKKPARKSAKKRKVLHRNVSAAKQKQTRAVGSEAANPARGSGPRDRAAARSGVTERGVKVRKPSAANDSDGASREFPDAVYLDR